MGRPKTPRHGYDLLVHELAEVARPFKRALPSLEGPLAFLSLLTIWRLDPQGESAEGFEERALGWLRGGAAPGSSGARFGSLLEEFDRSGPGAGSSSRPETSGSGGLTLRAALLEEALDLGRDAARSFDTRVASRALAELDGEVRGYEASHPVRAFLGVLADEVLGLGDPLALLPPPSSNASTPFRSIQELLEVPHPSVVRFLVTCLRLERMAPGAPIIDLRCGAGALLVPALDRLGDRARGWDGAPLGLGFEVIPQLRAIANLRLFLHGATGAWVMAPDDPRCREALAGCSLGAARYLGQFDDLLSRPGRGNWQDEDRHAGRLFRPEPPRRPGDALRWIAEHEGAGADDVTAILLIDRRRLERMKEEDLAMRRELASSKRLRAVIDLPLTTGASAGVLILGGARPQPTLFLRASKSLVHSRTGAKEHLWFRDAGALLDMMASKPFHDGAPLFALLDGACVATADEEDGYSLSPHRRAGPVAIKTVDLAEVERRVRELAELDAAIVAQRRSVGRSFEAALSALERGGPRKS